MEPSVAVPRAGPLEISTFYFQKDFPELSVVIKGKWEGSLSENTVAFWVLEQTGRYSSRGQQSKGYATRPLSRDYTWGEDKQIIADTGLLPDLSELAPAVGYQGGHSHSAGT